MKKIFSLVLILVISSISYGQCVSIINGSKNSLGGYKYHDNPSGEWYLSGAFNVDDAFNITTNEKEKGLNYDVELGVRYRSLAYYAFYGQYSIKNLTNYGVGLDYFIVERDKFEISLGINTGALELASFNDDDVTTYFAYVGRVKPMFNISNSIGIFLIGQYQSTYAGTIDDRVEGMVGLQLQLN